MNKFFQKMAAVSALSVLTGTVMLAMGEQSALAAQSAEAGSKQLLVSVEVKSHDRNYNWDFKIKKGEKFRVEVDGSDEAKKAVVLRIKRDKRNASDKNEYTDVTHGEEFTAHGDHINSGCRFYMKQESGHNVWVNIYKID